MTSTPNQNPAEGDPSDDLSLLKSLGVPEEELAHAASSLGGQLGRLLREDPFSLCARVGASFVEIDAIAVARGMNREDPRRLRAGIRALMRTEEGEGSSFSIRTNFLRRAARLLQVSSMAAEQMLDQLAREGVVLLEGERLWSRRLSALEEEVAERILWLCSTEAEPKEQEPVRQKRAEGRTLRAVPGEAP